MNRLSRKSIASLAIALASASSLNAQQFTQVAAPSNAIIQPIGLDPSAIGFSAVAPDALPSTAIPITSTASAPIPSPIGPSAIEIQAPAWPAGVSPQMGLVQDDAFRAAVKQVMEEEAARKKAEEEAKNAQAKREGRLPEDRQMQGVWNNGMEFATKNKDFKFHAGGRVQFDNAFFSVQQNVQSNLPNNLRYRDGFDFRRGRLRMEGTMYRTMDWCAEIDFFNSFVVPGTFAETATVAPTDLWWQWREVPWFQTVRIGNQKEQIGFEHIVSSRFLPFMERSYNQDAFYGGTFNGFTPGIQFFKNYGDETGVISGGLFRPVNNVNAYSIGTGDYSVVARMTRLLVYANEGQQVLHVGVSGRQATAVQQQGIPGRRQTYRTREAVRSGLSGDWPVPAGITLFGDDQQWVNGELVGMAGRWTFQSEYLVSALQDARQNFADPTGTSAVYHGGYVQLLCFLTDDHDHYSTKTGTFERVVPKHNFYCLGGKDNCGLGGAGAWQVGARYDYLDLNDAGFNGGILHNMTSGLNWFLNPNSKFQFNYITTYRDVSDTVAFPTGSGWIHGFGTRLAFDF